jgi:hypothetical protein
MHLLQSGEEAAVELIVTQIKQKLLLISGKEPQITTELGNSTSNRDVHFASTVHGVDNLLIEKATSEPK